MEDKQYFAVEALSASGAKQLLISAAHYKAQKEQPQAPSPAMVLGTITHQMILEPAKPTNYSVRRLNWSTKDGKAEKERLEAIGLPVITAEDEARVLAMRKAVMDHPTASAMIKGIERAEHALFWKQHDVDCKAKFDAITRKGNIIDLKTAVDASPSGFARAVGNFKYHLQVAHYMDGLRLCEPHASGRFQFIVVESNPPHAVAVYELDAAAISAGAVLMKRAAEIYKQAMQTNVWQAYTTEIVTLSLPLWAMPPQSWDDAKPAF
jgi:exodeoxyribonuclease VIII